MSEINTGRKQPIVKTGLFVVIATILIAAAGISTAKQSSRQENTAKPAKTDSKRQVDLKPAYVPGEVIVRLKDRQADGIGLLSLQDVTGHQTALLRLQADYGLSYKGPVFGGAHQRQKYKDMPTDSTAGKVGILSSAKPKVSAQRSMDRAL